MDEFGYLSVLLSVVIGLAVTQILQGFRERMLIRERMRDFLPTRLWAATVLLVCAQTWWAMFGLRSRHDWAFDQFLVLLAQTIVLYLIAGLVYPNFAIERAIDMRVHYFAQRRKFFTLLIVAALLSIARDLVLDRKLPETRNLYFHIGFIALAVVGVATAKEWVHKALALVTAVTFVEYITTLFVKLR